MSLLISDKEVFYDASGVQHAFGGTVAAASTMYPLSIKQGDGTYIEDQRQGRRAPPVSAVDGSWSLTLPWPSECSPNTTKWVITRADGTAYNGTVPEGVSGPLTLQNLINTYAWAYVQPTTVAQVMTATGPQGPQGPSGSAPTAAANTVVAGPTGGASAPAAPRALVAADIPSLSAAQIASVNPSALTGTGTVPATSLPIATSVALGGVKQGSNVTIAGDGTLSVATPATLSYLCVNDVPYGAVGDCKTITGNSVLATGGAMTALGTGLTVTGATFTSADVGKGIVVQGAATNGGILETTISAVTDSTHITLSNAAVVTVSTATVAYGTDNTAAFSACFDDATTAGKRVYVRDPGDYLCGYVSKTYNGKHLVIEGVGAPLVRIVAKHPSWYTWDFSGLLGGQSHIGAGPYTFGTSYALTADITASTTGPVASTGNVATAALNPGDLVLVGDNNPTWSLDSAFKLNGQLVEVLTVDTSGQFTPKEFFWTGFTQANSASFRRLDPIRGVVIRGLQFVNPIVVTGPTTVGATNGFLRISCARNLDIDVWGRGAAGANIVTRYCHTVRVKLVSEAAEYSLNSGLIVGGTSYQRFAYGYIAGVGNAHVIGEVQDTRSGSAMDTSGEGSDVTTQMQGYTYDVVMRGASDNSPTNGFACHPGSFDVLFDNVKVSNSRGTGIQARCPHFKISGGLIENSQGTAIWLFNNLNYAWVKGVTVRGAIEAAASNAAAPGTSTGNGISVSTDTGQTVQFLSIVDCDLEELTRNGVRVSVNANDLHITNNRIRNFGKAAVGGEVYGITTKGTTYNRVRIVGNVFDDGQATPTGQRPLALNGAVVDQIVANNVAGNIQQGPSDTTTGTPTKYYNNVWGQRTSGGTLVTDGIKLINAAATGAITLDATAAKTYAYTLTGNVTITPSNALFADSQPIRVMLLQDATGSRTVTWNAAIKFAGGAAPTMTATAGKRDIYTLEYSAADSAWYCTAVVQNL